MAPLGAPWRFGPTGRSRLTWLGAYLVLSVSAGALLGWLLRRHDAGVITGLAFGTFAALWAFRRLAMRAFGPTLALGRDTVFLVHGPRTDFASWDRIDVVKVEPKELVIVFRDGMNQRRSWTLPRTALVLPAEALAAILTARAKEPEGRENLPPDSTVQASLGLRG
jgi:hypothetical protein